MKAKVYTAALVGTGRIGFSLGFDKKREQPASHTMALLGNKRIKLVAACDTDQEKLEVWRRFVKGAHTFASSNEMYKAFSDGSGEHPCENGIPAVTGGRPYISNSSSGSSGPDIITIAVNEDSHLQECLAAIEARPRLVILEKPVALNSQQALQLQEAAERAGVPVMVNHERRFALDYAAAKAYLKEIGTLQTVRGELYSGLRIYAPKYEEDGAYSLLHDGTHLVDIISWLLDEELENPLVTGIYKDDKDEVRNFSAHFTTKKCPEVTITMSGRSRFFSFGLDILGTEGRICLGNGYAKFYKRKESKLYTGFYSLARDRAISLPKKTKYFANMVQNAVDYLDGSAPLKSPLSDAIADLRTLEAIKEKLWK